MRRWQYGWFVIGFLLLWGSIARAQTIWWDNGTVKYRKDNSGTNGDPVPVAADICSPTGCAQGGVKISAGINEFEPFQIFIAAPTLSSLSSVDIVISNLKDSVSGTVILASEPDGAPKNVILYRQHYLNVTSPSSGEGKLGLWPDALIPKKDEFFGETRKMPGETSPAFPFTVAANKKQGIWIDVYVPPGTPAGVYKSITDWQVTINGVTQAKIPVELTVRNFELPSTPTLKTAWTYSTRAGTQGHYQQFPSNLPNSKVWELTCLYSKELLRHRISNDNIIYPTPVWTGTKIDWSPYSSPISTTCNERHPEFLSGEVDLKGKLPGAAVTRIRVNDGTFFNNPAKHAAGAPYYNDYVNIFTANGWKSRLYYYLWDEPFWPLVGGARDCTKNYTGGTGLTHWRDLRDKSKFFKDSAIDIPIMVTTSKQAVESCIKTFLGDPDWTRYIDFYSPGNKLVHNKTSGGTPFNGNLRKGYDFDLGIGTMPIIPGSQIKKEFWWYHACGNHECGGNSTEGTGFATPMADLPSLYSRIFEWLTFQYSIGYIAPDTAAYTAPGPHSEIYFQSVHAYFPDSVAKNPWQTIYYFTGNGDGTLFYPGIPDGATQTLIPERVGGTKHIPISTIRLKMLREAVEDYEYLVKVEAKKNAEGIDGKKFIQDNILKPYLSTDGTTFITYAWNKNIGSPTSIDGLYRARAELAKVLDNGAPSPPPPPPPSSCLIISDCFGRANNTNLGTDWNEYLADLEIFSNEVRNVTTGSKAAQFTQNIGVNQDASVDCKTTASGNMCAVIARWTDANNYYYVKFDPGLATGDVKLFKVIGGVTTTIGEFTDTTLGFNTYYNIRLLVQGSSLKVFFNKGGTPVISGTDTSLTTGSYSGIRGYAAAVNNIYFDNFDVKVPAAPCSNTDCFDRPNNTNLGASWNEYLTDLEIFSNQIRNVDTGSKAAQHTSVIGADQDASVGCKVPTSGNMCAVMARWTDANNYYYAKLDPGLSTGDVKLLKVVAGVATTIGEFTDSTLGFDTYYNIRLTVHGSSLKVYFNNGSTPIISVTDTSLATGSYAGIRSYASAAATNWFDSFNVSAITGGNQAPTASFTASPTSGAAPLLVNFDGSGSSDPDGTISSYAWDFGNGATGSGVQVSHTYSTAGTYTVKLTVTDNLGATGRATKTITVTGPTTLFSDEFNRTTGLGADWAVDRGSFTTDGSNAVSGGSPSGGQSWARINKSWSATDYEVEALLTIPTSSFHSGVIARGSSTDITTKGYVAQINTDGTLRLYLRDTGLGAGNEWVLLKQTSAGIAVGTKYKLKLVVKGSSPSVTLEAWLDGVQKFTYTDSTYRILSGVPGMQTYYNGVKYDSFVVRSVP